MINVFIYKIIDLISRAFNKLFIEPGIRASLMNCGNHVKIGRYCELKPLKNISVGNRVEIGPNALFWTTKAKIIIGDDVIFGPGVTIITGDHQMIKTIDLILLMIMKNQLNVIKMW